MKKKGLKEQLIDTELKLKNIRKEFKNLNMTYSKGIDVDKFHVQSKREQCYVEKIIALKAIMKNKKYKVKIPKGYILVNETKTIIDGFMTITLGLESIPTEKPIKKELPKSWEELEQKAGYYIEINSNIAHSYGSQSVKNKNIWPTKELAEADLALSQLIQLRERYNESNEIPNYFCSIYKDEVDDVVFEENCSRGPLKFFSKDIGLKFWDTFTDLLETAKPLL